MLLNVCHRTVASTALFFFNIKKHDICIPTDGVQVYCIRRGVQVYTGGVHVCNCTGREGAEMYTCVGRECTAAHLYMGCTGVHLYSGRGVHVRTCMGVYRFTLVQEEVYRFTPPVQVYTCILPPVQVYTCTLPPIQVYTCTPPCTLTPR